MLWDKSLEGVGFNATDAQATEPRVGVQEYYGIVFNQADSYAYAYRNGVLEGEDSVTRAKPTGNWILGHAEDTTSTSDTLNGRMDAVAVYSRLLSAEEIRRNMLNYHNLIRDGLVGWWRFEEGTGLTAYDESGNGNDGDLKPSDDPPTWVEQKKWEMRTEAGV